MGPPALPNRWRGDQQAGRPAGTGGDWASRNSRLRLGNVLLRYRTIYALEPTPELVLRKYPSAHIQFVRSRSDGEAGLMSPADERSDSRAGGASQKMRFPGHPVVA
ncbi:hypothetical protein GAY28_00725 [Azospirillum brasilense]|nr:hypothetical protein [Azospirillum brasilense]